MKLFRNEILVGEVTILDSVKGESKISQINTFGGSFISKGRKSSDRITFITQIPPSGDAQYKLKDDDGNEKLIKIIDIDPETDDIVVTAIIKE